MKKSQQLHQLIHTMSKSEKRYFKLNNSKENSIYLKVFDTILNQETSNVEELKLLLKNEQIHSPLARIQHHLYQLLLKYLAAFQNSTNPYYEILDKIKYYILLRDRGLQKQGRQLLERALKMTVTHNFYGLTLEIYNLMEDWVTEEESYTKASQQIQDLHNLLAANQSFEQKIIGLKEQIYQLRLFFLKHKFARTKSQKDFLMTFVERYEPLLKKEDNLLKRRLLLTILIYTYYGLQAYDKLIETEKERLNLLHKNALSAHISPFLVYAYHRNLLWILLSNKNYQAHQYLVEQLNDKRYLTGLKMSPFYTIKLTIAKAVSELYAYVEQKHYHQAYHEIESLWELHKIYPKHWDANLLVHSLILFINTTFCLGKYPETIHWLHLLERDVPQPYLLPYRNMGKIAHLLIHDALGDQQYVQNLLESTRIRLYRKHNFFEVADIFLKYLKKQIKTTNSLERHQLLKHYKAKMEQIAGQEEQKGFFILFNFVDWFDSKLEACPIAYLNRFY